MDSPSITARPDVAVATTQPRVTPTPPRTQFKEVLAGSLVASAQAAMKVLPGSPLMAVAVRGANGPGPAIGVPMGGPQRTMSAEGPSVSGPNVSLGAAAANAAGGVVGASPTGVPGGEQAGIESSLQQSQEMNLYYLQIQETVNAQNRSFTTLSNVLKAEHDTVKTAIGNIR
jgi:hypothetical protein